MKYKLIWLDTGFACGGFIINTNKIIIKTAPIFKWMKNKTLKQILTWKYIKEYKILKL